MPRATHRPLILEPRYQRTRMIRAEFRCERWDRADHGMGVGARPHGNARPPL